MRLKLELLRPSLGCEWGSNAKCPPEIGANWGVGSTKIPTISVLTIFFLLTLFMFRNLAIFVWYFALEVLCSIYKLKMSKSNLKKRLFRHWEYTFHCSLIGWHWMVHTWYYCQMSSFVMWPIYISDDEFDNAFCKFSLKTSSLLK